MSDYVALMSTTGKKEEAEDIAKALLSKGLAACVQITAIESFYTWKGSVANDPEFLMLIKTRAEHARLVQDTILGMHSYETPEVVTLPLAGGSDKYLRWIDEVTTAPTDR